MVLIQPNYSHAIKLIAPDDKIYIGLTNNPTKLTYQIIIDKLYKNGQYILKGSEVTILKSDHYIRNSDVKDYEPRNNKVDFKGKNSIEMKIVIAQPNCNAYPAMPEKDKTKYFNSLVVPEGTDYFIVKDLQGKKI